MENLAIMTDLPTQDPDHLSMEEEAPLQSMNNNQAPAAEPVYRIPVTPPPMKRTDFGPKVDEIVRDYEQKYGTFRDEESPKVKESTRNFYNKMKPKYIPAPRTVSTTENERLWATVAHASALLTLIIGIPTGGFATLITLFVPLMIYFYYREKSEFVAYHAMQAFSLQVLGTVGWIAILVTGVLAGSLLSVVLAITLIGVLLIPFVVLAMILFIVASFGLPIGMVVFGMIGAWEAYQGHWYRVPYIGLWIERQLHGNFLVRM